MSRAALAAMASQLVTSLKSTERKSLKLISGRNWQSNYKRFAIPLQNREESLNSRILRIKV